MKSILFLYCLAALGGYAQQKSIPDNLSHDPAYKTSEFGAIPYFIKSGRGKTTLLLIPGIGFDASVFKDFMQDNEKEYTMYAVTLPGFGTTAAPPMPDSTISYGAHTWNNSAVEGIIKLMDREKLVRPIV